MVDLSAFTYMGVPLASIASLCVTLLLVIMAYYWGVGTLYYGAFFVAFLEFSRLIVAYPFSSDIVIWVLRGVYVLALLFLIPAVFSAYMSTDSDW